MLLMMSLFFSCAFLFESCDFAIPSHVRWALLTCCVLCYRGFKPSCQGEISEDGDGLNGWR